MRKDGQKIQNKPDRAADPQIHKCGYDGLYSSNAVKEEHPNVGGTGNGTNHAGITDGVLKRIAAVAKRKGGLPCTITPEELQDDANG